MFHCGKKLQGPCPRVERDRGRVSVHDKAVIDIRISLANEEGLIDLHTTESFDRAARYACGVNRKILIGGQNRLGTFDSWGVAEVEVTMRMQ
jgi:hypothetical protein